MSEHPNNETSWGITQAPIKPDPCFQEMLWTVDPHWTQFGPKDHPELLKTYSAVGILHVHPKDDQGELPGYVDDLCRVAAQVDDDYAGRLKHPNTGKPFPLYMHPRQTGKTRTAKAILEQWARPVKHQINRRTVYTGHLWRSWTFRRSDGLYRFPIWTGYINGNAITVNKRHHPED